MARFIGHVPAHLSPVFSTWFWFLRFYIYLFKIFLGSKISIHINTLTMCNVPFSGLNVPFSGCYFGSNVPFSGCFPQVNSC
ncbi:hypothetical protein Ppro_3858 (plasmid) [Pelobacter propionicus DSM 2379]|uniref:Uncharacterized protein n=1 Tax=Pelobacter propionicus (strain DSM 2379 / NBRC 103807 / OttBd1) TaxID=338966 RepID=A0R879_PELPD|nr:hypothetical protein Ppro_3858 [Pelobacter propionicus DSM 2379]